MTRAHHKSEGLQKVHIYLHLKLHFYLPKSLVLALARILQMWIASAGLALAIKETYGL